MGVEFRIANSLFTGPIAGLNYNSAVTFPSETGPVRLVLSQSFGYAVAGGQANYGTDRLGIVNLQPGVPEPATWLMMIVGFGLIGAAARRRQPKVSVSFA